MMVNFSQPAESQVQPSDPAEAQWVAAILASWETENKPGGTPETALPLAISPRKCPQQAPVLPVDDGPFCIAGKESSSPAGHLFRWRRKADERRLQALKAKEESEHGSDYVPVFSPLRKTDRAPEFDQEETGKSKRRPALFTRQPVSARLTLAGAGFLLLVLGSWAGGLLRLAPPGKAEAPTRSTLA